ncbi:MAG: lipid-A-disaccharide synthase [Acidobacteria bacterium]|nr:lipid-A-disaccharide synthase [Acidobacteriota bacterium]
MNEPSLLLVAGEASGDLHGARLLSALRRRVGALRAFGLGKEELQREGLELVSEESFAVVGLWEVLKVYRRAKAVFRQVLAEVDRRRPAAAVLVDFPEFNLRLARELKRRDIPVIYYISPQVWAWRRRRVHQIARRVDLMLVLFPFEQDFYRSHGLEVRHVGHPLVDEVPVLPQAWDGDRRPEEPFRLALLPGSRSSEVKTILPRMLGAVELLAKELKIETFLVRAATIPRETLEEYLRACDAPVEIVEGDRFRAVAGAHLALCASGTATLETGLLGTPLLVLHHLAPWTYLLARVMVKLSHFSLVNLVLGEGVVPELVQEKAEPAHVASLAAKLLRDPAAIEVMRRRLAELRSRLGQGGASERAAEAVAEYLGWRGAA